MDVKKYIFGDNLIYEIENGQTKRIYNNTGVTIC